MHGHLETHAMWHRLWPHLTGRITCIAIDLRGYGDSGMPADEDADHSSFSKLTMAVDVVEVMLSLGHDGFSVLAHYSEAHVARLAMDHGERVERMVLLDIAPTLDMYGGTTRGFA